MMRVTMHSKDCLVTIDDLSQSSAAKIGIDLFRLTAHGVDDRRVMSDDHALFRPQHGERPLQLQSLVNCALHERLHFRLSERSKNTAPKTADEPFGPGESDAIALVAAAIETLYALGSHHFCQFLLLAAFEVVITQHGDDRDTNAHERSEHRFHLFRLAQIGQIASKNEQISLIAHAGHDVANSVIALGRKVKIS